MCCNLPSLPPLCPACCSHPLAADLSSPLETSLPELLVEGVSTGAPLSRRKAAGVLGRWLAKGCPGGMCRAGSSPLRPHAPAGGGSRVTCRADRWWPGRGEIPLGSPRRRPGHVAATPLTARLRPPGTVACPFPRVLPALAGAEVCARPAGPRCSLVPPGPVLPATARAGLVARLPALSLHRFCIETRLRGCT